jgi:acyl carrier protein
MNEDSKSTFGEKCQTWFGKAQTAIPQPFHILNAEEIYAENTERNRKRNRIVQPKTLSKVQLQAMRQDRMWFKNVVFHVVRFAGIADTTYEDGTAFPKSTPQSSHTPESAIEYMQGTTSSRSKSPHEGNSKSWDTLRGVLSELLNIEIHADEPRSLDDLGADSLAILIIYAGLREELGISIVDSLFSLDADPNTIQELRERVEYLLKEVHASPSVAE